MSVMSLRESTRTAAKVHRCGMCAKVIRIGEQHHVSTNLYDGRVYDWRECHWCQRDRICATVHAWWGDPSEGVNFDSACEWAEEVALGWPTWWGPRGWIGRRVSASERAAARAWLARVAGGEGE